MKTRRIPSLFLASFGMAGLLSSACAKDATVQAQPTSSAPSQTIDPATPSVAPAPAPAPAVPVPAAAPVLVVNPDAANAWSGMKDLTFEQRPAFIAGLSRLEGIVDTEISGLNSKRVAMTTDTKDWDFAMKGLVDDQSYLKSMNDEVSKVDADNWIQERDRVQSAWEATQDAYAKVLHSTTAP